MVLFTHADLAPGVTTTSARNKVRQCIRLGQGSCPIPRDPNWLSPEHSMVVPQ